MLKTLNRNRSRLCDGVIKIFRRSNADDSGKPASNNAGKSPSNLGCGSGKPSPNNCGDSGKPQSNVSSSGKPETSGAGNQGKSAACGPSVSGKQGTSGAGNQKRSAACGPSASGKPGTSGAGGSEKPAGGIMIKKPRQRVDEIYKTRIGNGHSAFPVLITKGEGVYLFDTLGNKYLDFTAGESTVMLGHCHKKVAETMSRHAVRLTQIPQHCQSLALGLFSAYLTDLFGFEKVIVMNSGTEAVETAIKIARNFGYKNKQIPENQAKIIVPENSYWGKSLSAISTSNNSVIRKKYGPHIPGFVTVPFNDIKALEEKLKDPYVCGFLTEPIQVEAGVILPDKCYLVEARKLCDHYHVLIMCDEVQVGLGRCGGLTCSSLYSISPDILILGKALSSGFLPVSATMADSFVMTEIDSLAYGSTYGGFPLGCFVSIGAVETLLSEKLIANSRNMGEILRQALECALPKDCVKEIRGKGLLNAIELQGIFRGFISIQLFYELLCNGLIVKPPYDGIIRLCPPLCIKEYQIMHAVKIIRQALLKLRGYCEMTFSDFEKACANVKKQKNECNENIKGGATGAPSNSRAGSSKKPTKKSPMTQTSQVPHDKAVQCEDAELSSRSKTGAKKSEKGKQTSRAEQGDCIEFANNKNQEDCVSKGKGKSKMSKKKGVDEPNGSWTVESTEEEEESIPVLKSRKKNIIYDQHVMMENSDSCNDPVFYNISTIHKVSQASSRDDKSQASSRDDKMKQIEYKSNAEDCIEPPHKQSPCEDNRMKQTEHKKSDFENCNEYPSSRSPPHHNRMEQIESKSNNPEDCVERPISKHKEAADNENIAENKNIDEEQQEQQLSEADELPSKSTIAMCKSFPFTLEHPNQSPLLPNEEICEPYEILYGIRSKRTETEKKDLPKKDCPGDEIQPCKDDQAAHKKTSDELKKQECEKLSTTKQNQPKPATSNECKKIDRGKQPVTSKGIQPIPKKGSAVKKFYPQDGEIPSTSKGLPYECLKPAQPKEKTTDKEKCASDKPKNEDCKKLTSNENAESKNNSKPDSEKNSESDKSNNVDCSDPAYFNSKFSPDLFKSPKKK